jgi:hypothetical protein
MHQIGQENNMQQHIKILGVLNIVWGAMGAFAGLAIMLIFGVAFGIVGSASYQQPGASVALPIIAIIGGAISIFLLLISVPAIIAGIGLIRFRPWARVLSIIISALHLLNIPIGTALGIYGLWVLFSQESQQYFAESPVA